MLEISINFLVHFDPAVRILIFHCIEVLTELVAKSIEVLSDKLEWNVHVAQLIFNLDVLFDGSTAPVVGAVRDLMKHRDEMGA